MFFNSDEINKKLNRVELINKIIQDRGEIKCNKVSLIWRAH